MQADVLILGGGSSGCVMAARLSQDPARRVVLVEAGRDIIVNSGLPIISADTLAEAAKAAVDAAAQAPAKTLN